jgi:hypothetical protein
LTRTTRYERNARIILLLSDRGVDLSGAQETKTRKALEFFSKRLRAG